MSTNFSGHFDGKVIIPDEAVALPIGQKLLVRAEPAAEAGGQFADLAQFAVDLPDSPRDLSQQHDHYLYGTPKQ